MVPVYNDSGETRYIIKGDRIAQLAFIKTLDGEFVEVDELEKTERGTDGFGSTGK